jgi:hypothetical protein
MKTVIELKEPSKDAILNLQDEIVKLPQIEPVTEHYFSDGMYCRKMEMPMGMVVVGKLHKTDHFFMCTKGEIMVASENGMKNLYAGDIIEAKPGTKRVIYAVVDSIIINVHKTDKTDLDEIEEELIEAEEIAIFDSNNKLKDPSLKFQNIQLGGN